MSEATFEPREPDAPDGDPGSAAAPPDAPGADDRAHGERTGAGGPAASSKGTPQGMGEHSVSAERAIDAPVDAVWRALADPRGIAGWFVDGARREGSKYFWRWESFGEFAAEVVAEEEGERLVLDTLGQRGTPHRTEVRLRTGGGQTVVHIVESGFFGPADEDDEARGVRSGWAMALALLELYVTRYDGEPRHAFLTLRPAPVAWDTILAWFTDPALLGRWLGTAHGPVRAGGEAVLEVADGPTVSGPVLAVTDTEVSLAWAEGRGAVELKAFAGPDDQRFVCVRATHWGEERDFRGLEDAVEGALDRLAEALAEG